MVALLGESCYKIKELVKLVVLASSLIHSSTTPTFVSPLPDAYCVVFRGEAFAGD